MIYIIIKMQNFEALDSHKDIDLQKLEFFSYIFVG